MICFEGVTLRYPGQRTPAIRSLSLTAEAGAVTAIVGPNGSGKSTLVRALLGRVTPEQGTVVIDGASLAELSRRDVARRMAVVTQREEPVFPMLVRDFIALGRFAHGSLSRSKERLSCWMSRRPSSTSRTKCQSLSFSTSSHTMALRCYWSVIS